MINSLDRRQKTVIGARFITVILLILILFSGITVVNAQTQGDGFIEDTENNESSLRIVDFTLGTGDIPAQTKLESEVIIANYGTDKRTVNLKPEVFEYNKTTGKITELKDGESEVEINPKRNYSFTMMPGEHRVYNYYFTFKEEITDGQNTYLIRLTNGGGGENINNITPAQRIIDVVPSGSSTSGSNFVNRDPSDINRESPDLYKDTFSQQSPSPASSVSIPPVRTKQESNIIEETDVGEGRVSSFSGIQSSSTSNSGSIEAVDGRMNIGFAFTDVPNNQHYIFRSVYESTDIGDNITINVVNSVGNQIDPETEYKMYESGNRTTLDIHLSSKEAEYIQSQGSAYFVIKMDEESEQNHRIKLDSLQLISSSDIVELPKNSIQVQGIETSSGNTEYEEGEQINIEAIVKNTGSYPYDNVVQLFETSATSINSPIDSQSVSLNPNESTRVLFTAEATPDGQHQYVINSISTCPEDSSKIRSEMECPLTVSVGDTNTQIQPKIGTNGDRFLQNRIIEFEVQNVLGTEIENVTKIEWGFSDGTNEITDPTESDLKYNREFTDIGSKNINLTVTYQSNGETKTFTDRKSIEIIERPGPKAYPVYYDVNVGQEKQIDSSNIWYPDISGEIISGSCENNCRSKMDIGGNTPATSDGISMMVISSDIQTREMEIEYYGTYDFNKNGYAVSDGTLSQSSLNNQISQTTDPSSKIISDINQYAQDDHFFVFVGSGNPDAPDSVEDKLRQMGADFGGYNGLSENDRWSFIAEYGDNTYHAHHESYVPSYAQQEINHKVQIAPVEARDEDVPVNRKIHYVLSDSQKSGFYDDVDNSNIQWIIDGSELTGQIVEKPYSQDKTSSDVQVSVNPEDSEETFTDSYIQSINKTSPVAIAQSSQDIVEENEKVTFTAISSYHKSKKIDSDNVQWRIFQPDGSVVTRNTQTFSYNVPSSASGEVRAELVIGNNTDSETIQVETELDPRVNIRRVSTDLRDFGSASKYNIDHIPSAHYPLDNVANGGTVADIAGGADGIGSENIGFTSGFDGNGGADFQDTQEYISVNDTPSIDFSSHTQTAWVKTTNIETGQQAITGKPNSYSFKIKDGGLRFTTPGIKDHDVPNIPNLQAGEWTHIAVVFTEGEPVEFYVNGDQYKGPIGSEIDQSDTELRIGANQWQDEDMEGQIDDVRLYDQRLSARDIQNIYRSQKSYTSSENPYTTLYSYGSERSNIQEVDLSDLTDALIDDTFGEGSVSFNKNNITLISNARTTPSASRYVKINDVDLSKYEKIHMTYKRVFDRNSLQGNVETGYVALHTKDISSNKLTFGQNGINRGTNVSNYVADVATYTEKSKDLNTMTLDVSDRTETTDVYVHARAHSSNEGRTEVNIYDVWGSNGDTDSLSESELYNQNINLETDSEVYHTPTRDGIAILSNNTNVNMVNDGFSTDLSKTSYDIRRYSGDEDNVRILAGQNRIFCNGQVFNCASNDFTDTKTTNSNTDQLSVDVLSPQNPIVIDNIRSVVDKDNTQYSTVFVNALDSNYTGDAEFEWRSDTGDIENPSSPKTRVKFSEVGEHKIRLSIQDDTGKQKSISKTIQVTSEKPSVEIITNDRSTRVGGNAEFTINTQSSNNINDITVIFGDGDVKKTTDGSIQHAYKEPGLYDVTVIAETDSGLTTVDTTSISVDYVDSNIFSDQISTTTHVGNTLTLDATGNYDPQFQSDLEDIIDLSDSIENETELTYEWTLPDGSTVNQETAQYIVENHTPTTPQTVQLTAITPTGQSDTMSINVYTNNTGPEFVEDLSVDPTDIYVSESSTISTEVTHPHPRISGSVIVDTSDSNSYQASFREDNTVSINNIEHSFDVPPSEYSANDFPLEKDVIATITDETGVENQQIIPVTIRTKDPNAQINTNATNVVPVNSLSVLKNFPVRFDASDSVDLNGFGIDRYEWKITNTQTGESTDISGSSVVYEFTEDGEYNIELTVYDQYGNKDTTQTSINVDSVDPIANIELNKTTVNPSEIIEVDGGSSYDPDGTNIEYKWSFGNGEETQFGSDSLQTISYNEEGTYDIQLTVRDETGSTGTTTKTVEVTASDPVSIISADKSTVVEDKMIELFGTDSYDPDGTQLEYNWNFGDGTSTGYTFSKDSVTHSYDNAGTYQVELTVRDRFGRIDKNTTTIDVIEPSYFRVNQIQSNGLIESKTGSVSYTIENNGSLSGNQNVDLVINGNTVQTDSVQLDSGQSYTGTYNYDVNVGERSSLDVEIRTENETVTSSEPIDPMFVKTARVQYDSDWSTTVEGQYGSDYRVADWNDLEYAFSKYNSNQWSRITDYIWGGSIFVTRGGDQFYSSTRAYFASYHGGSVPDNYHQHDDINNDEISLGSWDSNKRILAVHKDSEIGNRPPEDCREIHNKNPSSTSGVYTIAPSGQSFSVYCDMDYAGGGWTAVMALDDDNDKFTYDSSYWTNTQTYGANDPNPFDSGFGYDLDGPRKYASYHLVKGNDIRIEYGNPSTSWVYDGTMSGQSAYDMFNGQGGTTFTDPNDIIYYHPSWDGNTYVMGHDPGASRSGINLGSGDLRFGYGYDEDSSPWNSHMVGVGGSYESVSFDTGGDDGSHAYEGCYECHSGDTSAVIWVR